VSHKIAVQRTVLAWPATALATVLAAALLGACSSSVPATKSDSSGPPTSTGAVAVASLHAMLPEAIKSSGVLRVASTFGYPPDEYYEADNKTPTGISVDLGNAVAGVLGLKAEFSNVAFDSILPGLLAGRYDTVIGALSATPERVKQFNMVTYQNAGAALLVSGGNPKHIAGLEDLCGLTVALLKGSIYIPLLQGRSATDCVGKGKSAIKLSIYDGSADYFQAVASRRADATYTGFEAAKYAADNSGGQLTFIDRLYPDIPYGAPFIKQNLQLAKAVQAAFTQIINNGTYGKIMAKWGVNKEAISASSLLQANG
jgi:polar amino acid transport system substrate-binding protein